MKRRPRLGLGSAVLAAVTLMAPRLSRAQPTLDAYPMFVTVGEPTLHLESVGAIVPMGTGAIGLATRQKIVRIRDGVATTIVTSGDPMPVDGCERDACPHFLSFESGPTGSSLLADVVTNDAGDVLFTAKMAPSASGSIGATSFAPDGLFLARDGRIDRAWNRSDNETESLQQFVVGPGGDAFFVTGTVESGANGPDAVFRLYRYTSGSGAPEKLGELRDPGSASSSTSDVLSVPQGGGAAAVAWLHRGSRQAIDVWDETSQQLKEIVTEGTAAPDGTAVGDIAQLVMVDTTEIGFTTASRAFVWRDGALDPVTAVGDYVDDHTVAFIGTMTLRGHVIEVTITLQSGSSSSDDVDTCRRTFDPSRVFTYDGGSLNVHRPRPVHFRSAPSDGRIRIGSKIVFDPYRSGTDDADGIWVAAGGFYTVATSVPRSLALVLQETLLIARLPNGEPQAVKITGRIPGVGRIVSVGSPLVSAGSEVGFEATLPRSRSVFVRGRPRRWRILHGAPRSGRTGLRRRPYRGGGGCEVSDGESAAQTRTATAPGPLWRNVTEFGDGSATFLFASWAQRTSLDFERLLAVETSGATHEIHLSSPSDSPGPGSQLTAARFGGRLYVLYAPSGAPSTSSSGGGTTLYVDDDGQLVRFLSPGMPLPGRADEVIESIVAIAADETRLTLLATTADGMWLVEIRDASTTAVALLDQVFSYLALSGPRIALAGYAYLGLEDADGLHADWLGSGNSLSLSSGGFVATSDGVLVRQSNGIGFVPWESIKDPPPTADTTTSTTFFFSTSTSTTTSTTFQPGTSTTTTTGFGM